MLWSLLPSGSRTSRSLTIPSSLVKMRSCIGVLVEPVSCGFMYMLEEEGIPRTLQKLCVRCSSVYWVDGILPPRQAREIEISYHEDV